MIHKKLCLIAAACSFAFALPVYAKGWTVDYTKSNLGFTGTQGSSVFNGKFKKFQTTIDLDPAKPTTGKITATVDISSVTAGSDERDSALPQSDWFDTRNFPQAQFVSSSIQPDACNIETPKSMKLIGCYKAVGTLSIKGIAKPVTLAFFLAKEGDHVRAQGSVPLTRTDFNIGEGQWSDEGFVKHAVNVTIDITAKPAS